MEQREYEEKRRGRLSFRGAKRNTKIFLLIAVQFGLILLLLALLLNGRFKKNQRITSSLIVDRLSNISELATLTLDYRGALRVEEGKIMFLTKKAYVMFYNAEIKAGIDMSKVDIDIRNKKITIKMPSAEILSYGVDPDSIEFFDEGFALFNWESKQDTVDALKIAEEDSKEKVNESQLLDQAYDRAKLLIQNYIQSLNEMYEDADYEIDIQEIPSDDGDTQEEQDSPEAKTAPSR